MNIYKIDPLVCYNGVGLIAANSAEEANSIIDAFVLSDPHNKSDSWGYSHVYEDDKIDYITTNEDWGDKPGIILYGIFYSG